VKIGDLVWARMWRSDWYGIILERMPPDLVLAGTTEVFKILWRDGTIGNNVYKFDLVANEHR